MEVDGEATTQPCRTHQSKAPDLGKPPFRKHLLLSLSTPPQDGFNSYKPYSFSNLSESTFPSAFSFVLSMRW